MARAVARAAARAGGGGGRSRVYLAGLACGVLAAVATPTALLAAILLAPALLVWFGERTPGRPGARVLMLFGAAGALPTLAAFWRGPTDMRAALAAAGDLSHPALAWAAQAAAWFLAEGLPLLARLAAEAGAARRAHLLRAERARLAEEWGLE